MGKQILASITIVVGAFALVAIVACGTYLGNMASIRTQQAEMRAQKEADDAKWRDFEKQLREAPKATPSPEGQVL